MQIDASVLSEIEKHIESLKNNPIFHMSLGSRELFHSNFLGWLGERHLPSLLNGLLHDSVAATKWQGSLKANLIQREERNIDLLVEFTKDREKCLLAVEVKVKDILRRQQLNDYDGKISEISRISKVDPQNVYKVALTLTEPSEEFRDWRVVTFKELGERLSANIGHFISDDQVFLRHYCNFIRDLSCLAAEVLEVSEDNYALLTPFSKDFFPDKVIQKRLEGELRLHSTFGKVLVTKLAHSLAEEALQSNELNQLISFFPSSTEKCISDDIFLTASGGYERGNGFSSIHVNKWLSDQTGTGKGLLSVGIMLQAKEYRLIISHPNFNFTRGNANNKSRRDQMYKCVSDCKCVDWLLYKDKVTLRGYAPKWIYTVQPFPEDRNALGKQITADLVRALRFVERETPTALYTG